MVNVADIIKKFIIMAIAANIICIWPSTNASIPTGWARETSLDAKYPKGAAAGIDPGATGGALTHTHTTQSHVHTAAHVHTVPDSGAGSGSTSRDAGTVRPPQTHTHVSNPNTINPTASLTGATPSTDGINNEPPFYTVIFVKSDGTPTGIPNTAVTLWDDTSAAPTGWNLADGGSGRPNLGNIYLKGAAAAGDGGSTGGAATHTGHTVASHDHGTNFAHDHPTVTSSQTATGMIGGPVSGANAGTATQTHTHVLTINSQATDAITGNTDTVGSGANEPPYTKQSFIVNGIGSDSLPRGVICMWIGTLAQIPTSWKLCDGSRGTPDLRSQFVKGTAALSESRTTGGSLTHTHTATGHTHAVASHTHTVTAANGAGSNETAGAQACATTAHTHPSWSPTGAASFTSGSGTPSVDNQVDTQPPFYGVAYVQYQPTLEWNNFLHVRVGDGMGTTERTR